MMEHTFARQCPHCGQTNEVSIVMREKGINEWAAFHCAACGLKIDDIRAADTPKTKITLKEVNEDESYFAEILFRHRLLMASMGKDRVYQRLKKSADEGDEMAIRVIKALEQTGEGSEPV